MIGRDADAAHVRELVLGTDHRLVTLTGTGGWGKRRLALQVAHTLVPTFPDGVWLVDVASTTDPHLVQHLVAAAVGCRERADEPLPRSLLTYLARRNLLLLLDSREHLLDACAAVVEPLLDACPGVRILATSRERLRIASEVTWGVPSLASPPAGAVVYPAELRR